MSPVRVARPAFSLTRAPQQLGTPVLLVFFTAPSTEWSRRKRSRLVSALAVPLVLSGVLLDTTQPVSRGSDAPPSVTVATDKATYRRGARIVVTIHNNLSVAIHALSGQTYCTIITALRKADGDWRKEGACGFLGGLSVFVAISPGTRMTVELSSQSRPEGKLRAGTYRIQLRFTVGSIKEPQETVYSEQFVISAQRSSPENGHRISGRIANS